MNFKNINKYSLFFYLSFLISCNSLEILSDSNEIIYKTNDKIELVEKIIIKSDISNNLHYDDYYNDVRISKWNLESKKNPLEKLKSINSYEAEAKNSLPLSPIIFENNFISINHKSEISFFSLINFDFIKKISLNIDSNIKSFFPTSLSRINEIFIMTYSDGKIISFDLSGKIYWNKNFDDISKTPVKIYNEDIILLLSNKIVFINSKNGEIIWEYDFPSKNFINLYGGDIEVINNFIFFVLPNGKIGSVDTIFGEIYNFSLEKINYENSSSYSISFLHSYNNYLILFDENKYLSTLNVGEDILLVDKEIIENINSIAFLNNSIFSFHTDGLLKAINIKNANLFWKIDLSEEIRQKDELLKALTVSDLLLLFFKSGKIIEIDPINGKILKINDLKIKDINKINTLQNYLILDHFGGYKSFFLK